jgi:thiol:disulfide interchange protein DsbC
MIRPTLLALAFSASLAACAAETPAADGKASANATPSAAPATTDAATRERIQTALQALAPGMKVDGIASSPIPGFLEVAIGARIIYVSQDGKQLLQGSLIDIASKNSLTQASEAKLRRGMLAEIGEDAGISFAADKPRHEVTVFTDIDCGYCRRMHSEIAEYNRLGITVNYLFYPRAGIGSESYQKAVNVWCAPDRRKALTQAKAGKDLPKGDCTSPITQDFALGRRIGLDGTPAIYAADGTQLGGYVPPAEMLARLDEITAKSAQ